ncbi:MAG: MFS transporter [Roseiarcus sp.]|uniref:MFS transporter n=1 Tax=Roseiarcus sp. TaxID=1969460 RepID=UPI003C36784B
MTAAFSSIAALLLSVLMLIGGNSLVGIVTPLRAHIEGFPDLTVGLLGSVYFAGMLAGTLAAPAIIRRGGHIRAYAAFVALAVVSVILMPVVVSPWSWLGCRGLIGFVFAGLYAVIEAWINAKATNANRGVLYALYQIANFAASGSGQLALKPLGAGGFSAFAVSGALLALAIVPMAMTSVDPPAQPRSVRPRLLWLVRKAPIPCFAVLAAGAANGAQFALGPVFAVGIGMTPTSAPLFTSSIVLGSALGVLPIAAISDRIDRRLVIAAVTIAGAACETALSRLTAPGVGLIVLGFLVGLTTYSLYTLAVSLANDDGAPHDLIFISVGLLFIYCVAAIVAPAIASVLMKDFGPQTLFLQNAYVHLAIAALALCGALARPRRAGTKPA